MVVVEQGTCAVRPAGASFPIVSAVVADGPETSEALSSEGDRRRDDRRQIAVVALFGLILCSFLMVGWFNRPLAIPSPGTWVQGRVLSSSYDPPTNKVELFQNQGDGQIFAHEAQDPALRHPDGIRGTAEEQAYRLQRPVYGWVGWLASGGQPGAVAWALVVVTVLSVAAMGAAVAWGCHMLGGRPLWGVAAYLAPGVLENLLRNGPEAFGTALVAVGLISWISTRPERWLAVTCFAVAGLCRETLLLVPLALVLNDMVSAHRMQTWRSGITRILRSPLLLSFVPYLLWVLALRGYLGAWPRGTVSGRLSPVPFGGLVATIGDLGPKLLLSLLLIAIPAGAAIVFGRDRRLKAVVVAHLALAASFGPAIWPTAGFVRVLLPLSVISLLALVDGRGAGAAGWKPSPGADRSRSRLQTAGTFDPVGSRRRSLRSGPTARRDQPCSLTAGTAPR